jgi:acyl-CoA hydrolase
VNLSEIEELFESGTMPIDVALIEVSPPDAHGVCSFGVGVDTTLTAAKCARYVVAQVKRQRATDLWRQLHSREPHRHPEAAHSPRVRIHLHGGWRVRT